MTYLVAGVSAGRSAGRARARASYAHWAGWAAAAWLVCLALLGPVAAAQGRGVYTVSGVRVDVTAATAAEAQRQGFVRAQRDAFERLTRRLTQPDELARIGIPRPDAAALDRMVRATDIEDARRSDNRYIARMAISFDPTLVRTTLRGAGLTVVDARTGPVLLAPIAPGATPPVQEAWRTAFVQGGFADELQPLAIAPAQLTGPPDWSRAAGFAEAAGAGVAVFAVLRASPASFTADLVEVGPDGGQRARGQVTVPTQAGEQGLANAMARLAEQASGRLQADWKARAATAAGQRARLAVSAAYDSQAQWTRIKAALEATAGASISEVRIDAVARDTAFLSFVYAGDLEQLGRDLRRNGVSLQQSPSGPVLRLVGGPG